MRSVKKTNTHQSSGLTSSQSVNPSSSKKLRVLFSLIAQPHQTLHSLPIAFEMALNHPEVDVHVSCLTQGHLSYIQELAGLYNFPPVTYDLLPIPTWLRERIAWKGPGILRKLFTLFLSRNYFKKFDAIVVPERTSLYLKRMGVTKPRYIYTQHGAGDRAVGFAKDIREFDFVLVPGRKIEERFLKTDLARQGHYFKGPYAKFDIVKKIQNQQTQRLFHNDNPTVLYNPHFFPNLTSWYSVGDKILDFFAHQKNYNLICAPHFRLLNSKSKRCQSLIKKYENAPNILIDPGSTKSIDMTYTMAADIYLGDVSSQVAEFLVKERPCIFINAYHRLWENDDNYRFWHLGQVIDNIDQLQTALDQASSKQERYAPRQRDYYEETFDCPFDGPPSAPKAAEAIVSYLESL